jgi:hypothetical protein
LATPKTIEAIEDTPGLAVNFAKKVNEKVGTIQPATKTKLHELLGDVGAPAAGDKLLKDDTDPHAGAGIKKLKNEIMHDKVPDGMRKDVHDHIFAVLAPVVKAADNSEFDFKADIDAIKAKLKPSTTPTPEAAHGANAEHGAHGADAHAEGGAHGNAGEHGDTEEHPSSEVTPSDVARVAVVGGAAATTIATIAGGISHPAGFATGAGTALKGIPAFFSGIGSSIWGGLNSFATSIGLNTGANATVPALAYAPAATAPIATLAGGWLAAGIGLRTVRRLLMGRRELSYVPNILAGPITEGYGLGGDLVNMFFGKRNKEGKGGGLVPTIHGATTEPLLNHAGRTLLPKKGKLRNTVFGTLIGGALLGPVGLVAGYLGSNWYSNKPAASASADAGHAATAHH